MRPSASAPFSLPLGHVLEDRNLTIRIFFGDIDALAVQIMTEGQREPIIVREQGGEYYIVDGHRRQRAMARAQRLRIAPEADKFMVYDGGQPLREAPGPAHADYDPQRIQCRLVDCGSGAEHLFASQWIHNLGKPFTSLERNLFLSRLLRQGGAAAEALALRIGFEAAEISQARGLYAADPRLLDQVRLGRIPPKLALRLVATVPAGGQIGRLQAARAAAEGHRRENLLPEDFAWTDGGLAGGPEECEEGETDPAPADPVHARLNDLVARLGELANSAPNPTAEERLATLLLIYRHAVGQISYDRLEIHLLGRR